MIGPVSCGELYKVFTARNDWRQRWRRLSGTSKSKAIQELYGADARIEVIIPRRVDTPSCGRYISTASVRHLIETFISGARVVFLQAVGTAGSSCVHENPPQLKRSHLKTHKAAKRRCLTMQGEWCGYLSLPGCDKNTREGSA
jgi:adenine-specific DNA methylase